MLTLSLSLSFQDFEFSVSDLLRYINIRDPFSEPERFGVVAPGAPSGLPGAGPNRQSIFS